VYLPLYSMTHFSASSPEKLCSHATGDSREKRSDKTTHIGKEDILPVQYTRPDTPADETNASAGKPESARELKPQTQTRHVNEVPGLLLL